MFFYFKIKVMKFLYFEHWPLSGFFFFVAQPEFSSFYFSETMAGYLAQFVKMIQCILTSPEIESPIPD